jgi:hypothetical protein
MSWWFSLILIVPLLGFGGTVIYETLIKGNDLRGVVLDAYSNKPVAGATVVAGESKLASDGDGRFTVPREVNQISIEKNGYDAAAVTVTPGSSKVEVRIRPNVVQGQITAVGTKRPIKGATVEAKVDGSTVASTNTDERGMFTLADVPENATIVVDSADYSQVSVPLNRQTRIDAALRPDVVLGVVKDESGAPIEGASIAIGTARTYTGADGSFRLEGAPESGEVVVKAAGYLMSAAPLDQSMRVDVSLKPFTAKALYATAGTAGDPKLFGDLLAIADRTEINAMVVDIKDSGGQVFYDTSVPLAREIDAVAPAYDAKQLVATLHEHNLYAIARLVVFEDPVLAEAKPDWAIHDSTNGGLWRTWNGLAWVNAHRSEVWDYNIALAVEAAGMGFDEIQLDYIRFPSDGPLNRAEYGVEHDDKTRPEAIGEFLSRMSKALAPTHAYLGADIFGLTMWDTADSGIGQNLETVAKSLDYICPMVYPSHFYEGSMGFDIPNDHPYEVILWSLESGAKRIPGMKAKLRPWLQDFSYGVGIDYTDNEVRRQIDASRDFGNAGWMLWNAANVYHEGALASQ